ncbi:hypothetical protein [Deinococcus alpinitundrae]|uniref:hypothetical protein n=1 Tax=Deinococcus alpinitundrae TaxID=468913 RepID=UPI00192A2DD8|nr:hypothetical protein [Deinococcus alpinitundrae]
MPVPPAELLVSLTLNRYGGAHRWAGLRKMGSDHPHLREVPGLRAYRLLGTGRGSGFGLGADLRRWARLSVWSSAAAFEHFEGSPWRQQERALTCESYTLTLRPTRWHGQWRGEALFGPPATAARGVALAKPSQVETGQAGTGQIAVLTRAAIRPARLSAFWRSVPAAQANLQAQPGLLASLGLGEMPLLDQATFSVWRDTASMQAYAYQGAGHREAIARSRRDNWLSEELFVRFAVLSSCGSWDGRDPLCPASAMPTSAPAGC